MAPVLGIPVINRPDLLADCLRSIDIDVLLVVIDNSGTGELGDVAADIRPDALIVEPAANLGYTASVNHIIRAFPHDPYWLVSNADTVFGPGDLRRLVDEPGGWVGINGDWRVFKLTAEAVDTVGLWDEAGFFNYCSDADYERRCDFGGIDRHFIDGTTTHVGSVAIKERYGADNQVVYPREREYFRRKWGVEVRVQGGYATPFDEGGHLGSWRADLPTLRRIAWGGDSRAR